MKPYVIVRKHNDWLTEPEVTIRPIVERPLQRMTEAQINALPDQFTCYSCQKQVKKRDIGGIELGQRLCKDCYPYLDEWWVGTIIRFDLRRHLPVEGYSQPKSKIKYNRGNEVHGH